MVIDIHAHIGVVPGGFQMPLENQLLGMQEHGIDFALISDITCGESQTKPRDQIPYQTVINQRAAETVRRHKDRLGLMLWCRPNAEAGFTEDFKQIYLDNRDIVMGLKVHPDISGLPFNDSRMNPYLEMAAEFSLPVLIHTQETPFSRVQFVCEMAERFPDARLILGHMSLSGSKEGALRAMAEYPNIYGDTAWVKYETAVTACRMGLADKLLFGTDSPIGGIHTYGDTEYYPEYYENPILSQNEMDKILFGNALRLFRIDR